MNVEPNVILLLLLLSEHLCSALSFKKSLMCLKISNVLMLDSVPDKCFINPKGRKFECMQLWYSHYDG